LPGGEHWIRLLFVMLFTLGIDSAFSFLEGTLTVLAETKLFYKAGRKKTAFVLATVAFLFSLMYATDAGLIFLDTIDYNISKSQCVLCIAMSYKYLTCFWVHIDFVMLLVGGFECFSAGWIYNIEEQIESIGAAIVFGHIGAFFGAVILACCLWFGLANDSIALWSGFVGLVGFYVLGMMFVVLMMNQRMKAYPGRWTWKSMTYELMFKNIADLQSDLSAVVGYLPFTWALLVKFFIPPVVLILFGLACDAENPNGTKVFGHYEGYVFSPYQILGILCVVFTGFLFLSSLVVPEMYTFLEKPTGEKPGAIHAEPQK
jgi:hypothetical protein